MPFFANTPEARLGRTDSLDPETTCRGITSSGRPCRRPIAGDGSVYCWQHKDQAHATAVQSSGRPGKSHGLIPEHRSSLDTLAERLGLNTSESEKPQKSTWSSKFSKRPTQGAREPTFFRCCCFHIPIPFDDILPPPRPASSHSQPTGSTHPRPNQHTASSSPSRPGRASRPDSADSETAQLMSLIPRDASPQTASQLLAELAKGFSPQDEPGYIYIFWLTPESHSSSSSAEAVRSLLAPPSTPNRHGRRASDNIVEAFARSMKLDDDSDRASEKKKTILLKIGRANNVQRRLNEWQRQCGYNLSLVRYYPYVSSSTGNNPSSGDDSAVPRKMPHSHKVERLVHIELAGKGMRVADRGKCEACGKEHREWFEVEATKSAVAYVDEVIRRWSDWDEAQGSS
ncbi:uncharacterized protein CTHT_0068700 [Thermochaetoides thermophila DSM 1495]|uniref:Bacteriophage T5 Orf172 DNA-binding domain-containing protein n=1 Tax=Chaetomium thermophilum (strain DSM 1495 / CBS 144.50 / IMI 039719) TaxID=759272 RepID=G0SH50_CHATD|nr:hypothetical protein CTHT_0068700 [Thermochaetoides thermophila DSM 1495]EGS17539.1 hypothetical protein CTHT_0068700 [Thermochaetoides thermophila DSM 1495]